MEQIIDNEYFRNLVSQMRDTGYQQEIDRVQINIPNAEERLRGGLHTLCPPYGAVQLSMD